MKDMVRLARTVERCQRNFDHTKRIPNKHVKYILNCATSMPTKQQQNFYNITVIEEEPLAREFYTTCAIDVNNPAGEEWRNSQTYAPLVLLYSTYPKYNRYEPYNDIAMSMGLSSGAAALAAANLGYKTGFCKCIDEHRTNAFVWNHFRKKIWDATLAVGIGHPLEGFDRTEGVLDGEVKYHAGSDGDKEIKIFRRSNRSL